MSVVYNISYRFHITTYHISYYNILLPLEVLSYILNYIKSLCYISLNILTKKIRQFLSKNVSIPLDQNMTPVAKYVLWGQNVSIPPCCILYLIGFFIDAIFYFGNMGIIDGRFLFIETSD